MDPIDHSHNSPWPPEPQLGFFTVTYECGFCKMINIAYASWDRLNQDGPYDYIDSADAFVAGKQLPIKWSPERVSRVDFPDVPVAIAEVATEAYKCQSVGAHRGAIMLARAVIEATAKNRGITVRSIEGKIEKMAELGLLTPGVVSAAHAVRDSGNAVAHGDFAEYAIEIEDEEAEEVLQLMSMILRDIFQQPAVAARVSEGAKKRKWRRMPEETKEF